MLDMIWTLEQLNKTLKKECFLYGAGDASKNIIRYASKNGIDISGIIVTRKDEINDSILGVNIQSIDECGDEFSSPIVVATTEKYHDEIKTVLENQFKNFDMISFVSDDLFWALKEYNGYVQPIIDTTQVCNSGIDINQIQKGLMKFIPRPNIDYLIIHILDHCNLRCQGCDHFACIADENFIPFETIDKDIKRMSEIFGGDFIERFAVMGGEPLLHPDLDKILLSLRQNFPYSRIDISSNGILLLKQTGEFWKMCRENNITINITKYPINLDFEAMKKKALDEGVNFKYHSGSGEDFDKKSFKKLINLNGNTNAVESFHKCHISNYGNMLLEGKFYGCAFSCQSYRIFNSKFNQNLRLTEGDFLNIYDEHTISDFCEFAAKPRHYCRYCYGLAPEYDWDRTRGEISEWVDTEGVIVNDCYRE